MKVDGNLKRLEQGLANQQRVSERSYWERCFLHLVIPGPHKPLDMDIAVAANAADAMLKEWRHRWTFLARTEDQSAKPATGESANT